MRKSYQNNYDLEDSTSWTDHIALAKRTKEDRKENLTESYSLQKIKDNQMKLTQRVW